MLQPTLFILTDDSTLPSIAQLKNAYESNNYIVTVGNIDKLLNEREVFNIIIVDLDSLTVKDSEEFKELLAESASRVLFICSTSLQRLLYYQDFSETFTSTQGLLEKEFFAFSQ